MAITNIIEQIVRPDIPKVVDDSLRHIYVPVATYHTKGLSKYDIEYFKVGSDGEVSLSDKVANATVNLNLTNGEGSGSLTQRYIVDGTDTLCNISKTENQIVFGKFNEEDATKLEIIGYGNSDNERKNIRTLDFEGNQWLAGTLEIGREPTKDFEVTNLNYVRNSLLKKLDKVTTITEHRQIYGKNGDGNQMMFDVRHAPEPLTVPQRDSTGTFEVGEPLVGTHPVTKKYADNKYISKRTETNNISAVYVSGYDGNDDWYRISVDPVGNTIPLRNSNGYLSVRQPAASYHAVNKQYVDYTDNILQDNLNTLESIVKGSASGYVFDTVEDLDTWLENADNVATLKQGDNLYILDTGVPDYWWDGTQKQELETQKVDLTEYVKNTDYASGIKAGIVKLRDYERTGLKIDSRGELDIYSANDAALEDALSNDGEGTAVTVYNIKKATLEGIKGASKRAQVVDDTRLFTDQQKLACQWLGAVNSVDATVLNKLTVTNNSDTTVYGRYRFNETVPYQDAPKIDTPTKVNFNCNGIDCTGITIYEDIEYIAIVYLAADDTIITAMDGESESFTSPDYALLDFGTVFQTVSPNLKAWLDANGTWLDVETTPAQAIIGNTTYADGKIVQEFQNIPPDGTVRGRFRWNGGPEDIIDNSIVSSVKFRLVSDITKTYDRLYIYPYSIIEYDSERVFESVWSDEIYRTIDFGSEPQTVNIELLNYLNANGTWLPYEIEIPIEDIALKVDLKEYAKNTDLENKISKINNDTDFPIVYITDKYNAENAIPLRCTDEPDTIIQRDANGSFYVPIPENLPNKIGSNGDAYSIDRYPTPKGYVDREIGKIPVQKSIVDTSVATYTNTAGGKAYSFKSIDIVNKTISLVKVDGSAPTLVDANYTVGRYYSLIIETGTFDFKADKIGQITSVAVRNGELLITVDTIDARITSNVMVPVADYPKNLFIVPKQPRVGDRYVGDYAVSLGWNNISTGDCSLVSGRDNANSGQYAFLGGRQNWGGYCSFGGGRSNNFLGNYASGGGSNNTITSNGSRGSAWGWTLLVDADCGFAANSQNEVHARAGAVFGHSNKILAGGDNSFIGGGNTNTAEHRNCAVFGKENITTAENQTIVGTFANPSTNALLTVGNGTLNTDKKNAFEVLKDGTLKVGNTTMTEEQLIEVLALIELQKLSGIYRFKNSFTLPLNNQYLDVSVNFTVVETGEVFNIIQYGYDEDGLNLTYMSLDKSHVQMVVDYGGWGNVQYQEIDFGSTPQPVPKAFYDWFITNTTKIS